MPDDPPPTLGYAPVEPEAAWSDGDDGYFEFHPPSPVIPLLERSVWAVISTLLALLLGRGVVLALTKPRWDQEFVAPMLLLIVVLLATVYWAIVALRSLIRAARLRDASIVIEFSPRRLRIENPIAWGDVSLVWKRAEVRTLELQEVGFTFGSGRRSFAMSIRKGAWGQREKIRFRSADDAAVKKLREALDLFTPRR